MIFFVCYHIYTRIHVFTNCMCSVYMYKPFELVCCFQYSNLCCTYANFKHLYIDTRNQKTDSKDLIKSLY